MSEDWHRDALCLEYPDVNFFPGQGESLKAAKAVCGRCVVSSECLSEALAEPVNPIGVWAGTSERDRRRLRKAGRLSLTMNGEPPESWDRLFPFDTPPEDS